MRLIWNGHSCFTLETAGGTVVVDPSLDGSVPGLAPIRLRADAVYCSHDHRDHGARELVALTGEKPAQYHPYLPGRGPAGGPPGGPGL